MTAWHFYGREKELAQVRDFIGRPNFSAGTIFGGRGIGKSELLAETRRRIGNKPSVLIFELEDPELEDQMAANDRLIQAIQDMLPQPVSSSIPPLDDYRARQPKERFFQLIRHLLVHGVVVCLDEFHIAKPMGLEGGLKRLIDQSRPLGDNPPGKLILMGSHQQQVLDMFRSTEPLHQRADGFVRLRQWKVQTVFEMASEQGLLQRPGRFLTLWCAFGGVPRNWERFANLPPGNPADMGAWESDDAWRMAFLDWHREMLADSPRERFDSKAFIELAEPTRDALLWLARSHPRGTVFSRFPAEMREVPGGALENTLDVLRDHLGMIERCYPFMVKEKPRWRIADNSTMFQIHVYPELFDGSERGGYGPEDRRSQPRMLDRLKTLEGIALERLTADCLLRLPGVTWGGHNLWRNRQKIAGSDAPAQLADIDVMALRGWLDDPDPVLMLVGCKRNPGQHNTALLQHQFNDMLDDLGGKRGERMRALRQEKLVVSPEFSPEQRQHYARSGFKSLDIREMARHLGIESTPEIPEPELGPGLEPTSDPSPF